MENILGFLLALFLCTWMFAGSVSLIGQSAYNRRVLDFTYDEYVKVKRVAKVSGLFLLIVAVVTFVYVNL